VQSDFSIIEQLKHSEPYHGDEKDLLAYQGLSILQQAQKHNNKKAFTPRKLG